MPLFRCTPTLNYRRSCRARRTLNFSALLLLLAQNGLMGGGDAPSISMLCVSLRRADTLRH